MSGRGWEAHSDVLEWSEAHPNVREWSGGPPGCPGVAGRTSWISRSSREPPSGCPCVVGWPFRMFGSGRKVLLDIPEWSRGHPGCPGVDERPSRMSLSGGRLFRICGCGRKAISNVWKCSEDPPVCPRVVGWPFRLSGSGRDALPDIREWL